MRKDRSLRSTNISLKSWEILLPGNISPTIWLRNIYRSAKNRHKFPLFRKVLILTSFSKKMQIKMGRSSLQSIKSLKIIGKKKLPYIISWFSYFSDNMQIFTTKTDIFFTQLKLHYLLPLLKWFGWEKHNKGYIFRKRNFT